MQFLSQIDLPAGLPIAEGGTGATTAAGARTNLGIGNAGLAGASPFQCGRLTLTTAVPVTTLNVTGASTVYFTPWQGNVVSIFDGTDWWPYAFSELSLALSGLTSGKNYDVFVYVSGGSPVIDLAPAWTNDSSRSVAISLLNGVYVNSASFTPVVAGTGTVSANRGTLLGTIRATGTNTTEDSETRRFLSNLWHPVQRHFLRADSTLHTYTLQNVRGWNNSSTNTIEWVACIGIRPVLLTFQGAFTSSGVGGQGARLGYGMTSSSMDLVMDLNTTLILGAGFPLSVVPNTGYQIFYVTESATGSGNSTYYYYRLGGSVWN